MENNKGYTLSDVIFMLLFIILFVFILMWIFPSKYYLNKLDLNSNCGSAVCNTEKTNNNLLFNQNISAMKEAAISYFTTSRLPKKIGEAVTMTLKQMRDEKLVLPLIDSNGNACEEGLSFIEMTKYKDEYILKVELSCSDYSDYILVHLGCYDYCDGDVCEKKDIKVYQYQYKLETACHMTDFSAWSNWTYNYVAANSNRKVETKTEVQTIDAVVNKSCEEGYAYDSESNKCYKTTESTDIKDAEKIVTYTCENGYTFDKADNKCKKTITNEVVEPAKANPVVYYCEDSTYTYNSSTKKCEKTVVSTKVDTQNATQVAQYKKVCKDVTKQVAYSCKKQTCSTKLVPTLVNGIIVNVPEKSCNYVNSTCYKDETTQSCSDALSGYSYNCNVYGGNYTLNGNKCVANITTTTKSTIDANKKEITYYCENSNHKLVGNTCKYTETSTSVKNPTEVVTYSCKNYEGYGLNNNKCEKITVSNDSKDLIVTTTCPEGYTLNNNKCARNVTLYRYSERSCVGGSVDYKWSNSENDLELIKKGYKYTGYKQEKVSK